MYSVALDRASRQRMSALVEKWTGNGGHSPGVDVFHILRVQDHRVERLHLAGRRAYRDDRALRPDRLQVRLEPGANKQAEHGQHAPALK